MSDLDYEARPLSRAVIRQYATNVRAAIGYGDTPYVPIAELLEFVLPAALAGFQWDICDEEELGNSHGLADPEACTIYLRNDVYVGACNGTGRDRLTVIHELGHLLLHSRDRLVLRRGTGKPVTYRDPEWQANCFAGEFLVSHRLVHKFTTIFEVAQAFGVSTDAAAVQLSVFKKEGIWQN